MSSIPSSFPTSEHIPYLNFNFEGLRRHSFILALAPEFQVSAKDRRLRNWLPHTLVTASRHYEEARALVIKQENADQLRDGGAIFHILDISEHLEHCISAIFRALMAMKRLAFKRNLPINLLQKESESISKLEKLRNQFEHMHTQIVSDEVGNGPISISFAHNGRAIKFWKKSLRTDALYRLLRGLYFEIGSMYPNFKADSAPERGGPPKLTITASVKVTDRSGEESG